MNYATAKQKVSNPKSATAILESRLKDADGLLSKAKSAEDKVAIYQDLIPLLGAYLVSLGKQK